jgi:phosphate-selective porin OprO and OprP
MKKSILLLFFIFSFGSLYAQEGQELGKEGVPLGVEARAGKLIFESKDGDFQWWLDSRIQIDGAYFFENKNTLSNGTNMRRATVAWKAVLWKDWQAEIDFDFAEGVETDRGVDARDIWVAYNFPTTNLQLQVGYFKDVFGLERLNSSRLLTFLERSLPTNAFTLGRRMGAAAHYWTDLWQVKGGVWGHEYGTRIDKGRRDEGYASTIRASIAPLNKKGQNIHIGGAFSYKIPDATSDVAANSLELKARTETSVFDSKLYHTGEITDVNYYNRFGGEFTAVFGPLYVQSEYMKTQVVRWYNKPELNFDGMYVMATYMLTGETRSYYVDEGEVGPIEKPKCPGWGAWELKARYSMLNLNDNNLPNPAYGGKGSVMSFGFNWYPNQNVKIQLEYNKADHDEHATSKGKFIGDDDFSMLQARFQVSL